MDCDYVGPRVGFLSFKGQEVYNYQTGIDKRTPEILKYLEDCEGPGIEFAPFVK